MSQKNNIAIEFIQAGKDYNLPNGGVFTALKPLNLSISKGECFGLLGHNGAGKTTTINLMSGVHKPTTGDIFIDGISVIKNPEQTKRKLGVVQQELIADSFFPLPVMLSIQSKLSGVFPDKEWIDFLLEQLLLKDQRAKTTRELSGGMKRRMMIARALVHKPQILILDEPTAGVDIQLRHSMWQFIDELNKNGVTILLTTHYLEEAEQFCGRIAIMKNGELVTLKENKELLALGGKHKISFVVKIENPESWQNQHAGLLQEQCMQFERLEKALNHNGESKISLAYDHQAPHSFAENAQKIYALCAYLNLQVLDIYTESPSVEDVFIKINEGMLTT